MCKATVAMTPLTIMSLEARQVPRRRASGIDPCQSPRELRFGGRGIRGHEDDRPWVPVQHRGYDG